MLKDDLSEEEFLGTISGLNLEEFERYYHKFSSSKELKGTFFIPSLARNTVHSESIMMFILYLIINHFTKILQKFSKNKINN